MKEKTKHKHEFPAAATALMCALPLLYPCAAHASVSARCAKADLEGFGWTVAVGASRELQGQDSAALRTMCTASAGYRTHTHTHAHSYAHPLFFIGRFEICRSNHISQS